MSNSNWRMFSWLFFKDSCKSWETDSISVSVKVVVGIQKLTIAFFQNLLVDLAYFLCQGFQQELESDQQYALKREYDFQYHQDCCSFNWVTWWVRGNKLREFRLDVFPIDSQSQEGGLFPYFSESPATVCWRVSNKSKAWRTRPLFLDSCFLKFQKGIGNSCNILFNQTNLAFNLINLVSRF